MKYISVSKKLCPPLLAFSLFALGFPVPSRAGTVKFQEIDDFREDPAPAVSDPIRGLNRSIFRFNDKAYTYVAKPVAHGYTRTVPRVAREGITNFFDNLKFPVRLVGSLLQAKVKRASQETEKFAINTTAGLAGFIRVSDKVPYLVGVPEEDIGQAVGAWGVGHGPYIVIPLLGPKSTRDLVCGIGDGLLNPVSWLNLAGSVSIPIDATDTVQGLPEQMDVYDKMTKDAIDPYTAARNAYISHRNAEVAR